MDGIIGLIIIISVIMKLIEGDKSKEDNKKKQSKKQSGEQWQQMVFDFVDKAGEYAGQKKARQSYSSASANRTYSGTGRGNAERASNNAYYYEQQRATKDRLRQKYDRQTTNSYAKNASKTDILTRAKENVQEEEQDVFKQEVHAEVCSEYRSHAETAPNLTAHAGHSPECVAEDASDIIKRVNDLIVMGYDGSMDFDRDFIAEGVEMLNSFSL